MKKITKAIEALRAALAEQADDKADMTIKLPPMLEPDIFSYVVTAWRDGVECEINKGPRYTVEQMEAYAREAVRLNTTIQRPPGPLE